MNRIRRLLRNVPVLLLLAAPVFLAAPAIAAEPLGSRSSTALPPGVTPQQVEAVRQAIQSGAPISSDVQKLLDSRPELKDQLPPELREKLEQKEQEKANGRDSGKKPAARPEDSTTAAKVKLAAPAQPRYDWRKSSYVGSLFSKRLTDNEAATMQHFGHELFDPSSGAGQLLENVPVGPGYVVGPGDEIVVKMWGRVEGTQRMVVDRDGKIFFPKFGSLYVAGKTFEEMRAFLKSKVSTIAEVSSDVTLGQMKGIRVSVVGEVRAPGWYNVSSFQTALQVLSIGGGMKDIGSLRRIKIVRGGKEVQEIDLYDLLLAGDTRADIRLQQGDVIFVPVVARLAAIAGEVRRPAIYELRDEKSLLDLVRVAGGFAPSAWKQRVQVERLEGNVARIVLDASVEELEKGRQAMDLADGDIVRVFPIVAADVNVVTLEGNVVRPGRYELKPGMTVGAFFKGVKDFLPETYFDYALLTRLVPPDLRKEIIPVNLREIVLEGKKDADVPLKARDTLTVYNRSAFRDTQKVTISGEVRRPGSFDLKKGSRVSDLVKLAGDLTKVSWLPRAEVVRIDEKMRTFRTIYFDLGKAMAGDEKENLVLEDEDQVRVHSLFETRYKKSVTISGDVNNPGEQILTEGMRLSDLLFKAGGFKESAYTNEAELVRREINQRGGLVKTQTMAVFPDKALAGDPAANVPLKENDLVVVRQIPEWSEKIVVTLSGEVQFPGAYAAKKGERLSSLITRAGGFTKDAYLKAAQFSRVSTQKTQQEAIDKLIEDLELEVAQKSQQVSGVLDKEDLEANKELVASRRGLIAQLKKTRAKGRVIIRLADNGKVAGTLGDVLLEDGDRLDVPKKMNVVNVVGRVYNPTGIVFDPARDSVGYYLRLVGGPTESADRDHIFLLKADGSVVTRETADAGFFAFGDRGLMSARVEPGDSILVPEKLVQTRMMKDVKDITQILYQIAVTAGVLILAF